MLIRRKIGILAIAGVLGLAAASARADECESMEKTVQGLINRHEPGSAKGNNATCSAFGYGLGLLKARRIVADECLEEGQDRTDTLAKLDRTIRTIQSDVDKNCQ